ncbi:MAG: LytTR family DNA-binding domain-containing protein [Ethanoligenens sp.]
MNVEIRIDQDCKEPKIIVCADALTKEVSELVEMLRGLGGEGEKQLIGLREEKLYLLKPENIHTVYTENQKVYARGVDGVFLLRQRLYELETMLAGAGFVRISHSEIVNFNQVESLDMSIVGTITLRLRTGEDCFVSRRFVEKIKRHLGL